MTPSPVPTSPRKPTVRRRRKPHPYCRPSPSSPSSLSPSSFPDPSRQEYECEQVRDVKIVEGQRHYLIQWKGYEERDNSWEPVANLGGVLKDLLEFEKEHEEDILEIEEEWRGLSLRGLVEQPLQEGQFEQIRRRMLAEEGREGGERKVGPRKEENNKHKPLSKQTKQKHISRTKLCALSRVFRNPASTAASVSTRSPLLPPPADSPDVFPPLSPPQPPLPRLVEWQELNCRRAGITIVRRLPSGLFLVGLGMRRERRLIRYQLLRVCYPEECLQYLEKRDKSLFDRL